MAYFKLRGRLAEGGRTTTMYIKSSGQFRDTKIGPTITGIKVTRDGDELDGIHVVMASPADVISLTPMEMDLHYGTLVPMGTAKIGIRDL
jgi:hypothetical protein